MIAMFDLATEARARSAVLLGSIACFVTAAFLVLPALILALMLAFGSGDALTPIILVAALPAALMLVAGLRLRAGKGMVSGSTATIFLLVCVIAANWNSPVVSIPCLIGLAVIGNAVRAVWLLRGKRYQEDLAETFR